MPWITPPPDPPSTFLWDIALVFWRMYLHWFIIADNIRNVWLLGPYLSIPFESLGYFCGECFQFFDSGNRRLQNMIAWLDGITSGDVLYDIFGVLFPNLRQIIDNVRLWFENNIRDLSFDLYTIIINPWIWIRNQLYDQTNWFWSFIHNPGEFILNQLENWYFWVRGFFDSPLDYVTDWVRDAFLFVTQLEFNPSSTVINWIIRWYDWFGDFLDRPDEYIVWWLRLFNDELTPLLNSPSIWFKTLLGDLFAIRPQDWEDFYRRLIEVIMWKIRSQQDTYYEMVKGFVIRVIMWYL